MSELLPCPFCGNTDDFEGSPFPNGSHTSWVVRCGVPHCSAELIGETPEDVIDRWNRRIAATKAQTVDVEAIREMIDGVRIVARLTRDDMTRDTFSNVADKLTAALPRDQ